LSQGSQEPKLRYNIGEGSEPQGSVTRRVSAFRRNKVAVFVIDKRKKPLMPCSEKRARKLLASGRARVHRLIPFSIRIVDREVVGCDLQPVKIKIDPGSKFTGIAVVRETKSVDVATGEIGIAAHVLNLFELLHRGRQISEALTARRQMRRRRRGNLRYREPRFLNRRNKGKGWLAPSLHHRVDTTVAWVNRFQRVMPVTGIAQELVRFDMQLMQNAEISGVEYQQGTLAGYEVREYLLNKWNRECSYCGAKDVPLQIEHIHSKACGGSNRISNLALACQPCNQKKGAQEVRVFLAKDTKRLDHILAQAKRPLKDVAAVNATRWALFNALKETGVPVTTGSGGLTKYNRVQFSIPKTHALDAVCVGQVSAVTGWQKPTLIIKATGRGSYQRTRLDAFGFPRGYLTREKRIKGFKTGDMVSAEVPKGKKIGLHIGRVAVRASGSFNIQTSAGVVQGISHKHCKLIQRADGYGYSTVEKMESEQVSHKARNASRSALYLPSMNAEVSRAK
jgi:5-methylcytosine-specific restriction endonuclease McrA